jgi:hypothetical protein
MPLNIVSSDGMPIQEQVDPHVDQQADAAVAVGSPQTPSYYESVRALFRQESMLGVGGRWAIKNAESIASIPDPDFNLEESLVAHNVPADEWNFYSSCKSEDNVLAQRDYIEKDKIDRDIIQRTPIVQGLVSSVVALVPDAILGAGILPARAAAGVAVAGKPILQGLAKGATAGAVLGAEYSAVKTAIKDDYDLEDAAIETAIATGFGGLLGSGVATINSKILSPKVKDSLKETLKTDFFRFFYRGNKEVEIKTDGSVNEHAIADLPEWFQKIYAVSPVGKCATHPFKSLNEIGEMFFSADYETPASIAGNSRYPAVEAIRRMDTGQILNFNEEYTVAFDKFLRSNFVKKEGHKASYEFFGQEVRRLILRGEEDHQIPEVKEAAIICKKYLSSVLKKANELDNLNVDIYAPVSEHYLTAEELKLSQQELINSIIMGEDKTKSIFGLTRIYDIPKCIEGRDELMARLKAAYVKETAREKVALINENHAKYVQQAEEKLASSLKHQYELTELAVKNLEPEFAAKIADVSKEAAKKVDEFAKQTTVEIEKLGPLQEKELKSIAKDLEAEQNSIRKDFKKKMKKLPAYVKEYMKNPEQETKTSAKAKEYMDKVRKKLEEDLDQSIVNFENKSSKVEENFKLKKEKLLLDKEATNLSISTKESKQIEELKARKTKRFEEIYERKTKKDVNLNSNFKFTLARLEREKAEGLQRVQGLARFSNARVEKYAEAQYAHIIGASQGRSVAMPIVKPISGGKITRPRSVMVDDELLTGFVITDPREIVVHTYRQLGPANASKQVLRAYGYESYEELAAKVENEYVELSKLPHVDKTKLLEDHKVAKQMVADIPSLMNGTFGLDEIARHPRIAASLEAASHINFARLFGGITLSSFNDIGVLYKTWGFHDTAAAYVREFAYSFTKKPVPKTFHEDLHKWGVATQYEALKLNDLVNDRWYESSNFRYGKGWDTLVSSSQWLARKAAYANMNNIWNDFNKRIAARLFADKLLRIATKEELSKLDVRFLAKSRFPLESLNSLQAEFKAHGEYMDGLAIPNTSRWFNKETADLFGASVLTNSNTMVIVPGVGDIPLFMRGLMGRFLVNYKSFQFGYTNNVLTKFFQDKHHRIGTVLATSGLVFLGKYLKALSRGDEIDIDKVIVDTGKDLDFLSWVGSTTMSVGGILLKGIMGGGNAAWREVGRNLPTADLVFTLADITNESFSGKPWSERGLRKVFSLSPLYTMPLVNGIINKAIRSRTENVGGKLIRKKRR